MGRRLSATLSPTSDALYAHIIETGRISCAIRECRAPLSIRRKPKAAKNSITPSSKPLQPFVKDLSALTRTLYLFTRSDLKTILYPSLLFAVSTAFSPSLTTSTFTPPAASLLPRLLLAAAWVWLNLLIFCIGNQRLPHSIAEDRLNKPWRPIPSERLTPAQAKENWITAQVIAASLSLALGQGLWQCLALMVLGYIHNDLGAGDRSCVLRNILNAAGFLCFGTGAAAVTMAKSVEFTRAAYMWYAIIAAVVFTTIQSQDMHDQEGDRELSRRTVPLIFGDQNARWSLAVLVLGWSLLVPRWWGASIWTSGVFLLVGGSIAVRYWTQREVHDDRKTYRIWNLWIVCLYLMSSVKTFGL
ncbi:MAG: hypothetical protein LQ342_004501 [Letrouitia transgressa]|nr:MAG: hypothetical protein LQ342_004501 [Letrouitia transgressa]